MTAPAPATAPSESPEKAEDEGEKDDTFVRVKWQWQSSPSFLVTLSLAALGLFALTFYAYYRNHLLELQEPVVETCVQHRVTQHVVVQ